jgi:hypothetical protein
MHFELLKLSPGLQAIRLADLITLQFKHQVQVWRVSYSGVTVNMGPSGTLTGFLTLQLLLQTWHGYANMIGCAPEMLATNALMVAFSCKPWK